MWMTIPKNLEISGTASLLVVQCAMHNRIWLNKPVAALANTSRADHSRRRVLSGSGGRRGGTSGRRFVDLAASIR